eukprot:s131_g9.t2
MTFLCRTHRCQRFKDVLEVVLKFSLAHLCFSPSLLAFSDFVPLFIMKWDNPFRGSEGVVSCGIWRFEYGAVSNKDVEKISALRPSLSELVVLSNEAAGSEGRRLDILDDLLTLEVVDKDIAHQGELQRYLHRQFEMQTKLLEDLHQDVKALLASPGSNPFTFIFDPEPGVGTVSSNPFPRQVSNGSALPPMASPVTASIQQVSSSFSLPPRPSREQPPAPPSPLALPVPQPDAVMPATSDARPTFMSVDEDSESDSEKKNPRGSVVSQRTTLVARDMLEKHLKARRTEEQADVDKDLGEVLHGDLSGPTLKLRLRKWVLSTLFSNIIMVFIVANAILLGIEIDVSSRVGQNDIPAAFGIINVFFVVVFVVETVLKLVVMGCHEYWRGKSWKWNAFDFLIVGLSVAETCLDYFSQAVFSDGGGGSVRVMRALRLARTLRGVRLFRLLRYFAALRGLLLSIASTLGSLLWTLVLLQLLFYVFAVIFAQLVTDYCRFETIRVEEDVNAIPKCPDDLHYWANVMDSMHTLFMAITGGVNWFDAYAPLRKVSLAALWLMNLFIVIGFFTILNVRQHRHRRGFS